MNEQKSVLRKKVILDVNVKVKAKNDVRMQKRVIASILIIVMGISSFLGGGIIKMSLHHWTLSIYIIDLPLTKVR